jgi:EAL domain-containing protein (putative c-di-GMP-specific phosphodiesterase class I)
MTNVIGRADRASGIYPDIDISPLGGGRSISRKHAQVGRRGGSFYVRDLGSRLGTLLNGQPLGDEEHLLDEGDTVTIGGVTLTFSEHCEWPKGLTAEWENAGLNATTSTQLPTELPLIAQLPAALNDGHLLLHYQPQVYLDTGEIRSVEALIRWNHPELGSVAPERYISLAEDTGFVRVLSTFALTETAAAISEWNGRGVRLKVGVNLSVRDLEDPIFGDRIAEVLESTTATPSDFTLEVTESGVMLNPGRAIATLDHLRSLGFAISIDDFGTGQSSLTYLKDLPADEVKLDKSFFSPTAGVEEEIVGSAVQMAHGLGMVVVAEGVETEDAARFLRAIGCEKAQGYYFGKPVPKDEMDLRRRSLS